MSEEMTREQAIKWLKTFKGNTGMTELSQAFDVAIAALSAEPCEDAISRHAAIIAITKLLTRDFAYAVRTGWIVRDDAVDELMALRPVNPQPKTGRWIKVPHGFKCSKCLIVYQRPSIFCPNCGAKMVEPQESEGV